MTIVRRIVKGPLKVALAGVLIAAAAFGGSAAPVFRYVTSFGDNFFGQLGVGGMPWRLLPTVVTGTPFAVSFATTEFSSAAISPDGRLWTWGSNCCGTLGLGDFEDRAFPTEVTALDNVQLIAGGATSASFYAIADGQVYGWGDNSFGQLGNLDNDVEPSPVPINGMVDIVAISAGYGHVLALDAYGQVYSFGSNEFGELGRPVDDDAHVPTLIPGLSGVVKVQAGFFASAVLLDDGTVMTFGANFMGQLGLGDYDERDVPTLVPGLLDVNDLSFQSDFMLAKRDNGEIYAWGANESAQLGLGLPDTDVPVPTLNEEIGNIAQIYAGVLHSFAVNSSGTTFGWGTTDSLGLGGSCSCSITETPTEIPSLEGMQHASLGYYHTLADVRAVSIEVVGQTGGGKQFINPTEWAGGSVYTATGRMVSSYPVGPGDLTLSLTSDTAEVQVPALVTIPEDEFASDPFTINHDLTSDYLWVQLESNGGGFSSLYEFDLMPILIRSLKGPKNLVAGSSGVGTVQLTNAVRDDQTIALEVDDPALSVPPFITILAGSSSATFDIQAVMTNVDTSVQIAAEFNDDVLFHLVHVNGLIVQLLRAPAKVYGKGEYNLQVNLNRTPGPDGATVLLDASTGLSAPSSVTFGPGEKSKLVAFLVNDVTTTSTESIKATLGDMDLTRTMEAIPNRVRSLSLSTNTVSLGSGDKVTATIELMAPVTTDTEVTITLSNGRATAPVTVVVPAGSNQATFEITPEATGGVKVVVSRVGLQRQAKILITP